MAVHLLGFDALLCGRRLDHRAAVVGTGVVRRLGSGRCGDAPGELLLPRCLLLDLVLGRRAGCANPDQRRTAYA
jgi:hypothetical protein